jgi:glucose/arabinose dehydrogenase
VRYAIYVDGVRSELAGASCAAAAATADGFACSARLPTLTAGAHTLELASFVTDSSLLESARSAALRVSVVTQVESAVKTGAEPLGSKSSDITNRRISLADGTGLVVDLVAGGLNRPADLAFIPDGLLIAQRDGTVRSVRDGRLSEPAALSDRWPTGDRLLAIAIDPDFARTRFVFAVVAGGGTFTVIRVREVGGTFGDRVILLGGISAAAVEPVASLRFGPDARLYAAFDDGGDSRQVGDAASPNGKILRLNADGTTPNDQAGASPIYAAGSSSPAGLDWQPGTDVLWVADAAQAGITPVTAESTGDGKRIRGVARASWRLPAALVPTAMAFTRGASVPALAGNLFVASGTGRPLLRVRFDPLDPSRVAATEPLLQDVAESLVAIAAGPDGAIYFATEDSIWRIVSDASSR